MFIRVYNYNTLERLHQFEAHNDYIRSVAIHPTQSYILTSSGRREIDPAVVHTRVVQMT